MFTQDGNLTGQKLHPQVMLTSHGLLYSTEQNQTKQSFTSQDLLDTMEETLSE